jgi:colanic acid/amylovoran biosynthesis glycosyltransferase
MKRPLKVVYMLLYFPRLTETFVAEEIHALRSSNIDVQIISLLSPGSGMIHEVSRELLKFTWNTPGLFSLSTWEAQLHFLLKSGRLYFQLLKTLLFQPLPSQPISLLLKRILIFLKAVTVARHLERLEVDLIHAHFAWLPGAAAWICARLLNKPFSVTVHAYEIFSSKNDLLPLVSKESTHVVAISKYNQGRLEELDNRSVETTSVIHCGINLEKFEKPNDLDLSPPDDEHIRIISVGSLVAKKGHDDLIDACHLLSEKGKKFTCTIIGSGPDEFALRQKIREYDLGNQIYLLGSRTQTDIQKAYYKSDVFVLAAKIGPDGDQDGLPVVLMEAGKAGLPIISTSISGIPEFVQHKITGWLVPPNDAAALADAINLLADSADLRKQLGKNAQALVNSQFNIAANAVLLAELFNRICEKWNNTPGTGTELPLN